MPEITIACHVLGAAYGNMGKFPAQNSRSEPLAPSADGRMREPPGTPRMSAGRVHQMQPNRENRRGRHCDAEPAAGADGTVTRNRRLEPGGSGRPTRWVPSRE